MGQIYENSLRTLVWLGMDHEGIAFETIDFLKKTSKLAADLCEKYGSVIKIPTLPREDNPISQDPHDWELYKKFIGFKWFTRTWVCIFVTTYSHLVTDNLAVSLKFSNAFIAAETPISHLKMPIIAKKRFLT